MTNKAFTTYTLLFLVTFLAGWLRFYNITSNPRSLNIDEVSFGYSAYSILKTGRDEYGKFMPLTFKSTGDNKNPIPVYLMVPSIYLFGLNEFGVRFPTALLGTLSIPVFFFLLKYIFKKDLFALIGSFFLAISAWHIHFSRYAYDPLVSSFFLMIGVLYLLKFFEGKLKYGLLSAIFLVAAMYSGFTQRLFVPIFVVLSLILNYRKLLEYKMALTTFIVSCVFLASPLVYLSIFGSANTRLGMIFLTKDIEYTRYVILDHVSKLSEPVVLLFFWIERYLNYLQPDFLFFNGLNLTMQGTFGLGVLYLFQLPLFVLGIIYFINNSFPHKSILALWFFAGIIPASLANNDVSAGRSLLLLPVLLIIITCGAVELFSIIKSFNKKIVKWSLTSVYLIFIGINLVQAFLIYTVHFPNQKSEDYMDGTKESIMYVVEHQNDYSEIVYDPFRGIEAPYIVNIPHMYYLFYSQYDPARFQEIIRKTQSGAEIDKFKVRQIDWPKDQSLKNTLYIGSPWSLPSDDTDKAKVLKKIYLKNGSLALLIVASK